MQTFKNILTFLTGAVFALFLWGIGMFFLEKKPIFYIQNFKQYTFYPINLTKLFFKNSSLKEQIINTTSFQTLKGVKLKAVYFDGKNGFVILEENNKTYFVNLGEKYKGYKLIKIANSYAIFEKNFKKYKLSMKKEKIKNKYNIKSENTANDTIVVSKKVFKSYKNNLKKIWDNIGLIKNPDGYLITYIKPGSIFEKIGLKIGDTIMEVNGRVLKNDKDAWDLYKHADDFDYFEVKINRNNHIKVLYYEMD